MRKSSAVAGIIGLILLIFAIIDYFIASGFHLFVAINLVAGVFALVLWATTASRESIGATLGSRTTRYGANALIYSLAFIALLVAINYLANRHDRRFDTTEEKVFSLSSQSIAVVKNLNKPLKLYGFFQGGENQKAHDLFESYAYASPKVTYELVDPDKHPELAERFKVTTMGTTRVQYGGEDSNDGTNVTELSEENLTNAIIKVAKGTKKIVDFLDGEGEGDPDDSKSQSGFGSVKEALEGEGYTVRKLFLASKPEVPSDTNLVVVAGPTRDVSSHVIDALGAYLKRGGHMMVTLRPNSSPGEPDPEAALIKMLGGWGVQVGDDVIVDQVVRLFAGPALGLNPVVSTYGAHPITNGFTQRTVFPMTRSVEPESQLKAGLTVVGLAKTSDTSWAETDLVGIFQKQTAKFDDKDRKGPVDVADAVDGDLKTLGFAQEGQAKMVVIGSTDFANNQYFNQFFNRDFTVNSVDWLAGEEKSISIRPRTLHASAFRLTVQQFNTVFALSVLLLPEMLLILGIAVWWERRN
ncbi:MAG: GldG family protein [Candidatus Binataceae bacterium]